jgi:hypothetical protein
MGRDTLDKCVNCGKFMSYKDFEEGHFHFIPLNEFGPEEIEWSHCDCESTRTGKAYLDRRRNEGNVGKNR